MSRWKPKPPTRANLSQMLVKSIRYHAAYTTWIRPELCTRVAELLRACGHISADDLCGTWKVFTEPYAFPRDWTFFARVHRGVHGSVHEIYIIYNREVADKTQDFVEESRINNAPSWCFDMPFLLDRKEHYTIDSDDPWQGTCPLKAHTKAHRRAGRQQRHCKHSSGEPTDRQKCRWKLPPP